MLSGAVPRIYERWWRPAPRAAWSRACSARAWPTSTASPACCSALSPGDGVLDVACGTGNFTRDFARVGGPAGLVVGIDVSRDDARRARSTTRRRRALENVAYVRGDAAGAAVPRRELRRRLLLRGPPPVRGPDARARSHDRACSRQAGGSRSSPRPGTAPRRCAPPSHCFRSGAACACSRSDELVDALEERGFEDVRQRIAGVTQFVGARRADQGAGARCPGARRA